MPAAAAAAVLSGRLPRPCRSALVGGRPRRVGPRGRLLLGLLVVVDLRHARSSTSGRAFGRRRLAPVDQPEEDRRGRRRRLRRRASPRWPSSAGAGCPTVERARPGARLGAGRWSASGIAGDLFESLLKRSAERQGQLGAHSRPRRRARPDRRAAVRRCPGTTSSWRCCMTARPAAKRRIAILGSTGSIGRSALVGRRRAPGPPRGRRPRRRRRTRALLASQVAQAHRRGSSAMATPHALDAVRAAPRRRRGAARSLARRRRARGGRHASRRRHRCSARRRGPPRSRPCWPPSRPARRSRWPTRKSW
ncbi:MAG: hypothetical protein MZU84_04340 [Sphingobacterium sp.]|nr:hypothetical protein [Sphingobacterium sp.]